MSHTAVIFAIVVAIVVRFVSNRVPVVLVALGTALALYLNRRHQSVATLSGLGDPAVILVASLFVVSAGLEAAGVTAWIGQALVAMLSPLITINGAVAALLPVIVVMAVRLKRATSQLL